VSLVKRLSKNQFKQQGAVKYLEELIQLLAKLTPENSRRK
jgi:hypothetical protein